MSSGHELGRLGEKIAAIYLHKYGFTIIDTNYRIRGGEIDIIAQFQNLVVFVEVKSRSIDAGMSYGTALEAVDRRKIEHIIKTAKFWIYQNAADEDYNYRFDVVELLFERKKLKKLNYIKSAFSL
jgi:putative endonuclease